MKRFISILMSCICFAGFAKAEVTDLTGNDNVIYVSPVTAKAGETLKFSVCMKNTAEIRGFQFNLYLPDGVTIALNPKGKEIVSLSTERRDEFDEHTLSVKKQDDGSYMFLCGSLSEDVFLGNDGEIISVTLDIPADMASGVYPLQIVNQKLTENDISKYYETELVETTLTVSDATDITGNDNVIYVSPVTAKAGETLKFSVCMKNTAEIRGFQFNLYLPDGVTIALNPKGKEIVSLSTERRDEFDEHTLSVKKQDDGSYMFLCGSLSEDVFLGNDGEIISVTLDIPADMASGVYPLQIVNQKLTENDISKYYETELVETTLTVSDATSVKEVNAEGVKADGKYLRHGRLVIVKGGKEYSVTGSVVK